MPLGLPVTPNLAVACTYFFKLHYHFLYWKFIKNGNVITPVNA